MSHVLECFYTIFSRLLILFFTEKTKEKKSMFRPYLPIVICAQRRKWSRTANDNNRRNGTNFFFWSCTNNDKALSDHTTSEEFENGGFTLKTHLMSSVHTTLASVAHPTYRGLQFPSATQAIRTPEEFYGQFGFVFEENWEGNHMIIVTPSFSKNSLFKMFTVHTKNRRFQIPPVWRAFVFVTD